MTLEDLRQQHTCSIDQAAELLGIARSTAYSAARAGDLPTLRLSHRLLVPAAKLLAMLGHERDPEVTGARGAGRPGPDHGE